MKVIRSKCFFYKKKIKIKIKKVIRSNIPPSVLESTPIMCVTNALGPVPLMFLFV